VCQFIEIEGVCAAQYGRPLLVAASMWVDVGGYGCVVGCFVSTARMGGWNVLVMESGGEVQPTMGTSGSLSRCAGGCVKSLWVWVGRWGC